MSKSAKSVTPFSITEAVRILRPRIDELYFFRERDVLVSDFKFNNRDGQTCMVTKYPGRINVPYTWVGEPTILLYPTPILYKHEKVTSGALHCFRFLVEKSGISGSSIRFLVESMICVRQRGYKVMYDLARSNIEYIDTDQEMHRLIKNIRPDFYREFWGVVHVWVDESLRIRQTKSGALKQFEGILEGTFPFLKKSNRPKIE